MTKQHLLVAACVFVIASVASAQTPPPAVDVTAADIKAFIDALPKDRVSDQPIRIAEVGGYKVGVYGVFRPKGVPGSAIRHQTLKLRQKLVQKIQANVNILPTLMRR